MDDIENALIGYEANTVLLNYDAEKFFGFYTDNMDFSFSNKKIAVFEEKQEIIKIAPNYGNDFQTEKVRTISVKIGTYNFFQAISLNDYKENDVAIKIPLVDLEQDGQKVTALLPLFYLKYMDDYGDNEDLWTGIGLTLDVALTFTGVGNINKLKYLRHIGKFGKAYRAWRNGNATAEVLFTVKALWSATQGVAALFEITSSLLSIYLEYYTNSCNNYKTDVTANINNITPNGQLPDDSQQSDEYKRCKLIDRILFAIQIGSLGMDLLASKMIKKHSKELELLGFPQEWDLSEFEILKTTFQDLNNLDINNYFNFINQIPDTYRATIGNKLLSYGDVTKQNEFLNDFGAVEQTEGFWKMMAKDGAEGVENWKKLLENGIENERRIFTYLEDTSLTNSLVRYYQDSNLKAVLRKLDEATKQKFLREMGDISPTNFAKFVDNPELVNQWLKYYDDAILRSDFKALGEDGMMKIIDELGELSDDLFKGIKRNPNKLQDYVNLNTLNRQFLNKNKDFWLRNDYSYEYIDSFRSDINEAVDYFTNVKPITGISEDMAKEIIKSSGKFQKGNLIELPMRIYLIDNLNINEEVLFNVDILFKKANGNPIKGQRLDIDALIIDTTNNKIRTPFSAKMDKGKTFDGVGIKKYNDAEKLEFFRNIPEDLIEAKLFIQNENKNVWNQVNLSDVSSIEIQYIDAAGLTQNMTLQSFKQKLKSTLYSLNDFTEINPETFGTTREELIKSIYYRIITD